MRLFACLPVLLFSVLAHAAPSEKAVSLSLPECLALALENNLELEVERLNPAIAFETLRAENSAFEPSFEISVDRSESLTAQAVESVTDPAETRGLSYNAGFTGKLPTGMTWNIGADASNSQSGDAFASSWSSGLEAGIRQPLLKNFGTDVNLADIRIARKSKENADAAFELRLSRLVADVSNAYYNLQFAVASQTAANDSLNLAKQLVRDNEARIEAGVMAPLDLTQAQAEAASREEGYIRAERAVLDADIRLKRLIYGDISDKLKTRLQPAGQPAPPAFANSDFNVMNALLHRADLRQRRLQLEQAGIRLTVASNQLLPTIDLTGSYRAAGVEEEITNSLESTTANDGRSWSAGVVVKIPLGMGYERSRKYTAEFQRRQAILAVKQVEQDIIVEVDTAAGTVLSNQKRHEAAQKARQFSEASLQAEQEKFKVGTTTSYTVSQFQRDLANARVTELKALSDWHASLIELARVEGTLLERNKITLQTGTGHSGAWTLKAQP